MFERLGISLAAALVIGAWSLPAHALVVAIGDTTSFQFNGQCDDCDGSLDNEFLPVTGTLDLTGFVGGTPLSLINFVGFTYDPNPSSTTIPSGFTVTGDDAVELDGTLQDDGTLSSDFLLQWRSDSMPEALSCGSATANLCYFQVDAETHDWEIGNYTVSAADIGSDGYFQPADQTSDAPEPMTLTVLGAGLAGLGLMRRRRRG